MAIYKNYLNLKLNFLLQLIFSITSSLSPSSLSSLSLLCYYKNSLQKSKNQHHRHYHHQQNHQNHRTTILITTIFLLCCTFSCLLNQVESCSSRSTPKPRPPTPTTRPNITFQTYVCPEAYAKWYCLNGATCFSVRIGESILYNCECANGYMGQRCEFKDLEGSYPGMPSRESKILEARITGGIITVSIVIIIVLFISYNVYQRNQIRQMSMTITPLLRSSLSSSSLYNDTNYYHHHHHYSTFNEKFNIFSQYNNNNNNNNNNNKFNDLIYNHHHYNNNNNENKFGNILLDLENNLPTTTKKLTTTTKINQNR